MRRNSASAIFTAGCRRIFTANAVDLFVGNFQRREQKLVRQFEIAFRVGGRHAAFVRPEKMDVLERNGARLGLLDGGGEEFLRDASAGKRDAMRSAGAIGRFDFVQPCAGGGTGQFVGAVAKESSSKFAM